MAVDTFVAAQAVGGTKTIQFTPVGRAAAAESKPMVLSTEDLAVWTSVAAKLDTLITAMAAANASLDDIETQAESTTPVNVSLAGQGEYETVAASATDQVLGATGASGDYFAGLLIVPGTTSPGAVSIKDGSGGSAITVFTGGASSVSNLVPFFVPIGAFATSSGWRVTTGANVSAFAVGNFT